MSFASLYNALRTYYGTEIEDGESLPTLYDNSPPFESDESPYDPPNPETDYWSRFTILPGETAVAEMAGDQNTYRTPGIVRVELYGPLGVGAGALLELVDSINVALRTVVTDDYCLRTPTVSSGRRHGEWWRIDISAPFFSDEMA